MEPNHLIITCIRNPFDPLASQVVRVMDAGLSVQAYVDALFENAPIAPYELAVSIDGHILNDHAMDVVPPAGSSIAFCAVPHGSGGGKDPLRTIAMLALVVASFYAPYLAANLATGFFAGMTDAGMAFALGAVQAGTLIGGSLLINAVLPPAMPDTSGGGFNQSSTYGWGAQTNPVLEGGAIPISYGTPRVTPPLIGRYVEIINNKQYLNLLYAVANHQVDSITGVRINKEPVANYSGVTVETRLGDLDQSVVQFFGDTHTDVPVGSKLGTEWTTKTTQGNTVQGIGIGLSCPRGLYYANDQGGLGDVAVDLYVEIRRKGDANWTRLTSADFAAAPATSGRWSAGYWSPAEIQPGYYIPPGNWVEPVTIKEQTWVEVEIGSAVESAHTEGDAYFHVGSWIIDDQAPRPSYQWRWLTGDEILLTPVVVNDYITISGAQTAAIAKAFFRDNLDPGQYEIRVRLTAAPQTGSRYATDVYWASYQELVYDDFTYPGTALLAVRALATDQLSGSMPVIDCLVTRETVPVWTGAAYEDKPADNPAWACYDILHNAIYGGNVNHSRIQYDKFLAWASWCTGKGYTCNIYFDTFMSLKKALDTVSILGRANVIQMGSKFSCIVDRPETVPTQRFLFNMGNIEKASFAEEWLPMDDRANCIEITYYDKELDYDRQTLEIHAQGYDESDAEDKKASVNLIGCVNRQEAVNYGNYQMKLNRYLTLKGSWNADVDALACLPGDIIDVGHDVPQWGEGGRIESATTNTVRLDREVTIAGEKTYGIVAKHQDDDTMEERTVSSAITDTAWASGVSYIIGDIRSAGGHSYICIHAHTSSASLTTDDGRYWRLTGTGLNITPAWTKTPVQYAGYQFGETDRVYKLMRIYSLTKSQELRRKVVAIEHDDRVYDDALSIDQYESASSLVGVSSISAQESYRQKTDGSGETVVSLSWSGAAMQWWVYYRENTTSQWILAGQTIVPTYDIRGLGAGRTYEFCVTDNNNPANGTRTSCYVHGVPIIVLPDGTTVPATPTTATGFQAEIIGDFLILSWDQTTDLSIVGYNITMNGVALVSGFAGNKYTYTGQMETGTYVFTLQAVNIYGQTSATASYTLEKCIAGPEPEPVNYGDIPDLQFTMVDGIITFKWTCSTDPQITRYDIFKNVAGGLFAAAFLVDSFTVTPGVTIGTYAVNYDPDYGRYFIRAHYSDGTDSIRFATIDIDIMSQVEKIVVRVVEPKFEFTWPAVRGAEKYEIIVDYGNVAQRYWQSGTTYSMSIPKFDVTFKIRAWSKDGRWSKWTSEEADITGIYNWNEVINANIANFAGGKYVNMAWITGNKVQRPSLIGGTVAAAYAANVNDSDLFNFAGALDAIAASNFDAIVANWFRENWWTEEDAYFESAVTDLGASYTGRLTFSLTRTLTNYATAYASVMDALLGQRLDNYTLDELMDEDVHLSAHIEISTDGLSWSPVENGAWVTMRYLRVRVSVLKASPLTDIQISAGNVVLDVPDIAESGTAVLAGGTTTKAVTFAKTFNVCNVVICNAAGNAKAWATAITKTGFTANSDVAASTIYWFAKGY